jgi:5'-3' exonuclease
MHALIDADIMCYEMGSAVDVEGFPIDWPLVRARIDMRINHIISMTEATSWSTFLTSQDGTNFRFKIATIKPYKGNRSKKDKPHWYQKVYDYIAEKPYTKIVYGQEADDAMSITQWSNLRDALRKEGASRIKQEANTVICTKDKDLKMVPGWHYAWPNYNQEEIGPQWITPVEATRWFYKQLLMGDAADNIPGLHAIGPHSQYIKRLDNCATEMEMFHNVRERYEKYFGSYWKFFLTENANLLWMRTYEDEQWTFPEGWEDYAETEEAHTS